MPFNFKFLFIIINESQKVYENSEWIYSQETRWISIWTYKTYNFFVIYTSLIKIRQE